MTTTTTTETIERWTERLPLAGQVHTVVETIQQRRQTLEQRGNQFKREITREIEVRREALADRVVQQSVGRALGLGAEVLGTLGERIQEVHGKSPIQWDRIDQSAEVLTERAHTMAERRAQLERPAIASYDELNVQQVHAALGGLSRYELLKLTEYERAHKNRVTVLREVERLLAAD
jgi:hypothetical protein